MLAAAAAEQNSMLRHSKLPLEVDSTMEAEATSAGAQPQPPATPETQSKSGRSKRGNRRGKSHSQTSINTTGSSNSTPEFQVGSLPTLPAVGGIAAELRKASLKSLPHTPSRCRDLCYFLYRSVIGRCPA